MQPQPAIFEEHEIRRVYDEATETWLFSVIDIIQVLSQQPDCQGARKYWKVLKGRLDKEGSLLVTNCYQLKMAAEDGKQRLTDETRINNSLFSNSAHTIQESLCPYVTLGFIRVNPCPSVAN